MIILINIYFVRVKVILSVSVVYFDIPEKLEILEFEKDADTDFKSRL